MISFRPALLLAALLALPLARPAPADAAVAHVVTTVGALKVDRYTWRDSKGRPRSVSLKQEGAGNPGHGGYAVQMTYQVNNGGAWSTVVASATSGEGFGYFVSHENFRVFTDGSEGSVAEKFGADDSPLGRQFAVVGRSLRLTDPKGVAHRFTQNYPRYGTIAPIPKNANGDNVRPTPANTAQLKRYNLPITITWYFQEGTDYPRIITNVSLAQIPGPDRVEFDVRGPYGVIRFDNNTDHVIDRVEWADRFFFKSTGAPLKRNSLWTWTGANTFGRYTAQIAGIYEMGLFEPRRLAQSQLAHSFAFGRGKTSTTYRCTEEDNIQRLPCDWEWPYQTAQYSLPDNVNQPTDYKKIAWGSAPNYGTGPSLTEVFDTQTTSQPFNGFPANKNISYSVCIVLGRTVSGGLTKAAAHGPNYNCAVPSAVAP